MSTVLPYRGCDRMSKGYGKSWSKDVKGDGKSDGKSHGKSHGSVIFNANTSFNTHTKGGPAEKRSSWKQQSAPASSKRTFYADVSQSEGKVPDEVETTNTHFMRPTSKAKASRASLRPQAEVAKTRKDKTSCSVGSLSCKQERSDAEGSKRVLTSKGTPAPTFEDVEISKGMTLGQRGLRPKDEFLTFMTRYCNRRLRVGEDYEILIGWGKQGCVANLRVWAWRDDLYKGYPCRNPSAEAVAFTVFLSPESTLC